MGLDALEPDSGVSIGARYISSVLVRFRGAFRRTMAQIKGGGS